MLLPLAAAVLTEAEWHAIGEAAVAPRVYARRATQVHGTARP